MTKQYSQQKKNNENKQTNERNKKQQQHQQQQHTGTPTHFVYKKKNWVMKTHIS